MSGLKNTKKRGVATSKSEKTSKAVPSDCANKPFFYSILTGALTGFINGLFGGGGGMVLVPLLIFLLKSEPRKAHATALLIILPMSVLSGLLYAVFGSADFASVVPVSIGVTVGGIAGAFLLAKMPPKIIITIFSAVMAAAGVKMLFF